MMSFLGFDGIAKHHIGTLVIDLRAWRVAPEQVKIRVLGSKPEDL